jgi:hypothetical protein
MAAGLNVMVRTAPGGAFGPGGTTWLMPAGTGSEEQKLPAAAAGPVVVPQQPLAGLLRVLDVSSRPGERVAQRVLKFFGRHQLVPFTVAERPVASQVKK